MKFGLIGKSLAHSFSKKYFEEKFARLKLPHTYQNFEIPDIEELKSIIQRYPDLRGLNVTIPYKRSVIPFLDELDQHSTAVKAVNTVLIKNGKLKGFNTDHYGFTESLKDVLKSYHKEALILGSGGASRAVVYSLQKLNIQPHIVSRKPIYGQISYEEATGLLPSIYLVINTTPLGTFPETDEEPPLLPEGIQKKHVFFDLIYNPVKTKWLAKAEQNGAQILNGYKMLVLQAERSWQIWNEV